MTRLVILAGVSSLALLSSAWAADLPTTKGPAPYVPPPQQAYDWTGVYIGINGGYGGNPYTYPFNVSFAGFNALTGQFSLTSGGFLGGGQAGINYQVPSTNFVVGVEADGDASSIRGQLGFNAFSPIGGGLTLNAAGGTHLDYLGTVRGRFGYAFDRVMPYVTGGFAYGGVDNYGTIGVAAPGFNFGVAASHHSTQTGWTAGAGVEYAITDNLTLKTEYLYADLGTSTLFSGNPFPFPAPINVYIGEHTTAHIVRAGLNYKFDWLNPAPVVSKY